MPRLIDDIRSSGKFEMPSFVVKVDAWEKYAHFVSGILEQPELPVLLIDNVADYYFRGNDQEMWSLDRDFPNLAPPFPAFWTEHKMPTVIHSKDLGNSDLSKFSTRGRVGTLVCAIPPEDCTTSDGDLPAGTKWVLWGDLFIDYGQRGHIHQGPHGAMFLAVDEQGVALNVPWMQSYCVATPQMNDVMRSLMTWLHPTFLAICFLHCKNVKVVDEACDKPLAKKYHAKTGRWPTQFKTLVIEPLKQILRKEGRSDQVGIKHAMHICRGHFADYTQGRGLFGKYHGKFWIPSSVRGTKKGAAAAAREIEVKI